VQELLLVLLLQDVVVLVDSVVQGFEELVVVVLHGVLLELDEELDVVHGVDEELELEDDELEDVVVVQDEELLELELVVEEEDDEVVGDGHASLGAEEFV